MRHKEMMLDPERELGRITAFIRSELRTSGLSNIVVGLSGGVDSALTACLCSRAVGAEHVFGFVLPYRTSAPETRLHGRAVAEVAGISCEGVEITPAVDALRAMLPTDDRIRVGNMMARVRMIVLYDRSAAHKALVAGTGNRTEALLGYTTLHGDSACGFAPIAHLYKCQVRQLAAHLGVPRDIITKSPSADLWQGQTDEGELGFTYDEADWLLFNMFDRRKNDDELAAMGFSGELVERVHSLIARSEFKRRMPNSLVGRD